jgi:uncharacterized protein (TIGR02453 family)
MTTEGEERAHHLSQGLFDFLFDLDVNNDRTWFDSNRDRYESQVREPLRALIRDAEAPLHRQVSPHLVADDRRQGGSMFRIHRDLRFAKDKRPYKTNAALQFRHDQGRETPAPLLYLHLEPGNCFAGAGMYRPDNPTLTRLRTAIVAEPARYEEVLAAVDASDWEFGGDALTRAPRGFDTDHPLLDELKRTSFVLMRPFDEDEATSPGFLDDYVANAARARPLLEWQCTTLDLPF